MRRVVILAAAMLAIAACAAEPEHAEWQRRCIAGHSETASDLVLLPDGRGGITTMPTSTTIFHCDAWRDVCVPGRDGSITCPPR